ncbi:MAG: aminomethyl-transferring glycine dehydrogenase subunit GcvPA, partial [Candidatus Omnitrophica bacterium]|nr:aminomethyl-transferring glycine dehydrogenase subunit GcvPA [Candidatus Omnitrophota bacterium]
MAEEIVPYHPMTAVERQEMLEAVGVDSAEEFLRDIPSSLRNPKIALAEPFSEIEIQKRMKQLGAKNKTSADQLSFLGAGCYEHFIPAAVAQIAGRPEFYTAYTPYQPEASQGTLQAIYEYQSLVTELTGLDVSNASHYDGATSLAEAAILAVRHTDRTQVIISKSVHPDYRRVLATYLHGTPYKILELDCSPENTFDRKALTELINEKTACVVIQSPNFFGVVEDLDGISEMCHMKGALFIMVSNPLSLAVLKSPGEWGADLAVGDGQPFGIPMTFGGPLLGYFAATRTLMRKIPGRLAGMTQDSDGKRAFCLTIQGREQHIRRERASSNICTNQALC